MCEDVYVCDVKTCTGASILELNFDSHPTPLHFCKDCFAMALMAQGGKYEKRNLEVLLNKEIEIVHERFPHTDQCKPGQDV